jgi:hypothetical protein
LIATTHYATVTDCAPSARYGGYRSRVILACGRARPLQISSAYGQTCLKLSFRHRGPISISTPVQLPVRGAHPVDKISINRQIGYLQQPQACLIGTRSSGAAYVPDLLFGGTFTSVRALLEHDGLATPNQLSRIHFEFCCVVWWIRSAV